MKNLFIFSIVFIVFVFTTFCGMAQTPRDTIYVLYKNLKIQDTITSRSYSNGIVSFYHLDFGQHSWLTFKTVCEEQNFEYKFEEDNTQIKKIMNRLFSFDFLSISNYSLFNKLFTKRNMIYLIDPANISTKSIKFKRTYVSVQEYKRE